MTHRLFMEGEVALTYVGDIPVIGAKFFNRREAVRVVKNYMQGVSIISSERGIKAKIFFKRQGDGRYELLLQDSTELLARLKNVDELLLQRLKKSLSRKKLFILTGFVERAADQMECLVITEGLGTVVYQLV